MATLNELLSQKAALEKARARGVRRVTFADGKAIEYASFNEMTRALDAVNRDIAAAQPADPPPVAIVYADVSKGL